MSSIVKVFIIPVSASIEGVAGSGIAKYDLVLLYRFIFNSFMYFLCKFRYLFLNAFHSVLGRTCSPHRAPFGASLTLRTGLGLLLVFFRFVLIFLCVLGSLDSSWLVNSSLDSASVVRVSCFIIGLN